MLTDLPTHPNYILNKNSKYLQSHKTLTFRLYTSAKFDKYADKFKQIKCDTFVVNYATLLYTESAVLFKLIRANTFKVYFNSINASEIMFSCSAKTIHFLGDMPQFTRDTVPNLRKLKLCSVYYYVFPPNMTGIEIELDTTCYHAAFFADIIPRIWISNLTLKCISLTRDQQSALESCDTLLQIICTEYIQNPNIIYINNRINRRGKQYKSYALTLYMILYCTIRKRLRVNIAKHFIYKWVTDTLPPCCYMNRTGFHFRKLDEMW